MAAMIKIVAFGETHAHVVMAVIQKKNFNWRLFIISKGSVPGELEIRFVLLETDPESDWLIHR